MVNEPYPAGIDPKVLAALSKLPPKDLRPAVAEFAQLLNVAASVLEREVRDMRREDPSSTKVPFVQHAPADAPVDAAQVLTSVAELVRKYIIVEPEQAHAMALWVAHTHLLEAAEHSPLLLINAPERECGKSLVLDVLGSLASKSMQTANASMPALFRLVEKYEPTLLIDEADTFVARNPELQGVVNAGHKRGACVWRAEASGDNYEPRPFTVFCPKCIAGIALERHLPDATMSRGIAINMRRKLADERVDSWRDRDPLFVDGLARALARLGEDLKDAVSRTRPETPRELGDRARDNWTSLLAIAQCAGGEWPAWALSAAIKLSGKSAQPVSMANELLRDVRDVLADFHRGTIPTVDLLEKLVAVPEGGWQTYNRGRQLTAKQLAKLLHQYGIRPKTVRQKDGRTPKGYDVRDFEDAFHRYLKDEEEDAQDPIQESSTTRHPTAQLSVSESSAY